MKRLFPHPLLTLGLILIWMLLINEIHLGSFVLASLLGIAIPLITAPWWPDRAPIRNFPALLGYILLVLWDIVVANIVVARIILFYRSDRIKSAWVTVPLDLRSPEAISLLMGTITMTPGTVTADMSACGRALLIHSLHAPEPEAVVTEIKSRYEARLKRIFE